MSLRNTTHEKWMEAAYLEFAEVGPSTLSIKSLATKTGLPRATFYYYFDDREDLIRKLLRLHLQTAAEYMKVLKRTVQQIIPDLYHAMIAFKTGIMFHRQLLQNRHVLEYNRIYTQMNFEAATILVPAIKTSFNLTGDDIHIIAIWNALTDSWYSRLDFDNFTVEAMSALTVELMTTLSKVESNA